MDLITYNWKEKVKKEGPLAMRMRPRTLEEFMGQEEILAPGTAMWKAITSDRLVSSIFYGPPGTGKTTLAQLIALQTRAHFVKLNAVSAGVAEVRKVIRESMERWSMDGRRTILFLDEIHRFNRSQQDALLSAIEDGTILFLGATTENPFFYLTSPLLSRVRIFAFQHLDDSTILALLKRALVDRERGLGSLGLKAEENVLRHLARKSGGDARVALNTLELAAYTVSPGSDGDKVITTGDVEKALSRRLIGYDRAGDSHYDMASALIKSIRGSDPDAAVYWMARMIKGGEDPLFIARRLLISASEDVGNADPHALGVAAAAAQAVQMVGMPEGRIILAQAAIYLACAPKSNASYLAIEEALQEVEKTGNREVPGPLRGTGYAGAQRLGSGRGYLYPHDFPGGHVDQQYLPGELDGSIFYRPKEIGFEVEISGRLEKIRRIRDKKGGNGEGKDS